MGRSRLGNQNWKPLRFPASSVIRIAHGIVCEVFSFLRQDVDDQGCAASRLQHDEQQWSQLQSASEPGSVFL